MDPPPAWALDRERQLFAAIGSGVELTARDRRMIRLLARHDVDAVEAFAALLSHVRGAQ
jgi:hypothetical protein